MRIGIVGAGIAGSSAARIGRELGHEVTLIDGNPGRAASRCALATIRPQWFDQETRGSIELSWRWYEKWGVSITQHAVVSNWRNPEPKPQRDWWLVDPERCLVDPDIVENAIRIDGTSVHLPSGVLEFDAVLNATGAYGGELAVPHEDLWGATLYSTNAVLDHGPLRIYHIRPYHTLTIADNRGEIRLGSSVAKTEADAIKGVEEMLAVAIDAQLVEPGATWQLLTGIRARVKGNKPSLPKAGERSASIGNLARSGYAITPSVIESWIRSL